MTKKNAPGEGGAVGGHIGKTTTPNIDRRREKSNTDERQRIAELSTGFNSSPWHGVELRPTSAAETVVDLRFRRHVDHLHGLGARATAELLAELGAERGIQTIIDRKLAGYAALTSEQLRATGGDRFPPIPIRQVRP